MSPDTYLRIICGFLGIGFAIFLVHNLATGATALSGRKVARSENPRSYWGAIGMGVFFVAGCGLFAALGSEQLPFLILGLFGGHLFQVLVTGEIMWTGNRVLSRAN